MLQNILLAADPAESVDFMIHGIFSYQLFGQEVWITTSHVCLLIVVLVLCAFFIIGGNVFRHAKTTPSGFQNFFKDYIGTIFIFILFSNISGLFGLRPPTADYGVTLPLGLITFTLIHVNAFRYNSIKAVWADKCSPLPPWLPLWMPINLISDIAVPISLSLRLFANVLSGTVMMALVYGLLQKVAYGWPAVLHVYFDLFSGAIQTYVFCMLTMTYISNAMGEEENA